VVHHNLIIGLGVGSVRYTGCILLYGTQTGPLVMNNTCYAPSATGVEIGDAGVSNAVVKNNIFNSVNTAINDFGTGTTATTNICSTNDTTPANTCSAGVTSTPGFVSVGSDFSLVAGGTAVNAGTAQSGYAYNGSAPDIGAFETFTYSSATVNENSLDVTLGMSRYVPVQVTTTGWSVRVGGVSRSVTSASLLSGTDSVVRIVFSGAVCAGGETWDVSYAQTGATTDSALIGNSSNQELLAFTNQSVTNNCGSAPPSDPGTKYIYYKFEDGTGTNANDETANNLDGTLTNSPSFSATGGHSGSGGVTTTSSSTQYVAAPYGSGVDPSTQSLTIAVGVLVDASLVNGDFVYVGSTLGTNQRFYISTNEGTWRIGIQSSSNSTASNLAVTAGWNRLCLNVDSGSDTATLYVNGAAGTSGAAKTYTSYTLASNLRIGSPFDLSPGTTYDEFMVYQSVVSCADDFQIWEQTSPAPTGTFDQKTHRFRKLRVDGSGNPITLGTAGASITVVPGAAFQVEIQTDCTTANCDPLGQRLRYNLAGGAYNAIPDSFGADLISFYGATTETSILSGTATCCITGALTTNDGTTNFTSAAIPLFDLAQDASTVQRYVIKLSPSATAGSIYCFRVYSQDGNAMDTYTTTPCVTVEAMSIGVGF
jgi:hypothetical protein